MKLTLSYGKNRGKSVDLKLFKRPSGSVVLDANGYHVLLFHADGSVFAPMHIGDTGLEVTGKNRKLRIRKR